MTMLEHSIPTAAAALFLLAPLGVSAPFQDLDDYEYEADEGLHEQEWYDPSDWFDEDDGVDYESDWWDTGYDNETFDDYGRFDYDPWYDYRYDYYDDYGYYDEYDYYEPGYDYYDPYDYDPYGYDAYRTEDFGYGYNPYEYGTSYDDSLDYGYHWQWDSDAQRWRRDYGYHYRDYQYGPDQGQRQRNRQDRQDSFQGRQQSQQRQSQQQQRQQETIAMTGELESYRRIQLQGQRDSHTLVKLRMQDGSSRIVNLGPRITPDQLGLSQGDRVSLRGRKARIDDKPVLLATNITVEGDRTAIPTFRSTGQQAQQQRQDRQTAQRETTLRGTLEGFQRIATDQNEDHVVVRLRLEDGRLETVCLGPDQSLEDLDLQRNSEIMVRGYEDQVNGRNLIVATAVRTGDRTVSVQPASFRGHDGEAASDTRTTTLRGRIQDTKQVRLNTDDRMHTLVKLDAQAGQYGREVVVDLGSEKSLAELGFSVGDVIAARGWHARIDGKPLFRAEQVKLESSGTRQ